MISISGHKIHAPKGVGALVTRKQDGKRLPLGPLMFGGGQELGLRPGTLPVHLVVGLGLAAKLAADEAEARAEANGRFRRKMLEGLAELKPILLGDQSRVVGHIADMAFDGIDAEEAAEALAGVIAVSTGAACTSQSRTCSHVLEAMGAGQYGGGSLRLSWCHMTEDVEWGRVVEVMQRVRGS